MNGGTNKHSTCPTTRTSFCRVPCVCKRDPFGLSWTIKLEHFQNEKHMELFNWPISLANMCVFFSPPILKNQ